MKTVSPLRNITLVLLPLLAGCFGDDLKLYEPPEVLDGSADQSRSIDGIQSQDVALPDGPPVAAPSDAPVNVTEPNPALDARSKDALEDVPSFDPDARCGAPDDPRNCGGCGHDCTRLPNVRPG